VLEDAHGVVDREHADEAGLVVDDGDGEVAGARARACRLLGVRVGGRDRRPTHEVGDAVLRARAHEVLQPDHPDDVTRVVEDGQRVDGLGVVDAVPDPLEGLARGGVLARRDVLGGHAPSDGTLRVAEDRGGEPAFLVGQAAQEPWGEGGGQLVEQLDPVVGVEVREDLRDLGVLQRVDEVALHAGGKLLEDPDGAVLREQPEDHRALGRREALEQRGHLVDGGGGDRLDDGGEVAGIDQRVDAVDQVEHVGYAWRGPWVSQRVGRVRSDCPARRVYPVRSDCPRRQ
jgi:hypothetical protein